MQVARVHNLQKSLIDQRNLLFSKLRHSWGCTVLTKYHHTTFTSISVLVELASVFVFNFCLYSYWLVFQFYFEFYFVVVSLRFWDPFRCIPSNRASGLQPLWTVEQFLTVLFNFHNHCTVEQS